MQDTRKHAQYRRDLRRHASKAEDILWFMLRNRNIGYKFRRQHSIPPYIVDFYCAEAQLVIEVDGMTHEGAAAEQYDEKRQRYLETKGYTVLRYSTQQVHADREAVAQDIKDHCSNLLSP